MNYAEGSLKKHHKWKDRIKVVTGILVRALEDLPLAYTPGVAQPCLEIQRGMNKSCKLTRCWNLCMVATNDTAVLGLGDIDSEAGISVMEDRCMLFEALGDVDAFPFCIKSEDVGEIINTIYLLSGSFDGVNLEGIAAPHCFEIERKPKEKYDILIFHDDQHGTATAVLSGFINALEVVGKDKEKVRVVVDGPGSAGIAVSKLLLPYGFKNLMLCNREGIMIESSKDLNRAQKGMLEVTNLDHRTDTLKDALVGANIFLGFSSPNMVTGEMVRSMSRDAIIFACVNLTPEIFPDETKKSGVKVISTGGSNFPNQISNVLVSPDLFRGVFDARAKDINKEMKMAAAVAITNLISDDEVNENNIIPEASDPRVKEVVAKAVVEAARRTGVARI